jgi:hypothetical protein
MYKRPNATFLDVIAKPCQHMIKRSGTRQHAWASFLSGGHVSRYGSPINGVTVHLLERHQSVDVEAVSIASVTLPTVVKGGTWTLAV